MLEYNEHIPPASRFCFLLETVYSLATTILDLRKNIKQIVNFGMYSTRRVFVISGFMYFFDLWSK